MTNERLTRYPSILNSLNFHFCVIAALSFTVLFAKLHLGDLNGYDDAVYAHEGREMLSSGDWWNVRLNGRPDFDKPPMFIWLEALAMMVLGVSDFAARAPSALLGLGTILLVYFLARELSDSHWLPIWSMMVLMSTHFFMKMSMHAMTSAPFTFFFTLAILWYLKGLRQPRYLALCGIAVAATIYTRSILGLIPLAIILIHLLLIGRAHLLRSGWSHAGFLLAIGLPLVWFVSQYQIHGQEFVSMHLSFTVENIPDADNDGLRRLAAGLPYYPLELLKTHWPWLPLMLVGMWMQAKKMIVRRDVAGSLLVIWVACILIPFSLIETRALRYILPAFPAFAILAAIPLNQWIPGRRKILGLKVAYGVLAATILLMGVSPKYRSRPEEMRRLAPLAEAYTQPDQPIILFTKRKPEWAHVHQIIWYAERRCHLLNEMSDLNSRLEQATNDVFIADRNALTRRWLNPDSGIEVLGESENFVCFRRNRVEATIPAQQRENPETDEREQ